MGDGRWATLYAFSLKTPATHYTYREHITNQLKKNKGVGGGRWETLYAFSLKTAYIYTYIEHITKAMQKRQRNKWVDCKVGLGGQRLQQLFMLESWEKNK